MATIATPIHVDHALMIQAETMTTGANVHNVRSLLFGYRLAVDLTQAGKDIEGELTEKLPAYEAQLRRAVNINLASRKR